MVMGSWTCLVVEWLACQCSRINEVDFKCRCGFTTFSKLSTGNHRYMPSIEQWSTHSYISNDPLTQIYHEIKTNIQQNAKPRHLFSNTTEYWRVCDSTHDQSHVGTWKGLSQAASYIPLIFFCTLRDGRCSLIRESVFMAFECSLCGVVSLWGKELWLQVCYIWNKKVVQLSIPACISGINHYI